MRWGDSGRTWGSRRGTEPRKRPHEESSWENVQWERSVTPKSEHLSPLCDALAGWKCFSKVLRQPQASLWSKQACLRHPFLCPFSGHTKSDLLPAQQSPPSLKHCSKKSTTLICYPRFGVALFACLRCPFSDPSELIWQINFRNRTFFLRIIHILITPSGTIFSPSFLH